MHCFEKINITVDLMLTLNCCRWWRQDRGHSAGWRTICSQSGVGEKLVRWLGEGVVDLTTQGVDTIVSLTGQAHFHLWYKQEKDTQRGGEVGKERKVMVRRNGR